MTAKENKRTNNIIITCLIFALVVLIPLTGVVADAAINAPIKDSVSIEDATVQTPSTEVKDPTTDVKDPSTGGAPSVGPSTGGENVETPNVPEVETIDPVMGKTISLDGGMAMVYYIDKEAVKDAQVVTIQFEKPEYVAGKTIDEVTLVEDYIDTVIGKKQVLRFEYKGIFAKELSVDVKVTIFADGEVIKTEIYSVKEYAMKQLAKNNIPANLKTLLVDMLNYGAAAQIYFNYNTDNLANADLTEDQQALASQELAEMTSHKNTVGGEDATVVLAGTALVLENAIETNYYLNLNGYKAEDLVAKITYVDCLGKEVEVVVEGKDFAVKDQYHVVRFSGLSSREMRTVYSMTVFDKEGNVVSATYEYSIESYAVSQLSKTAEGSNFYNILVAMMKYGFSAESYFNK